MKRRHANDFRPIRLPAPTSLPASLFVLLPDDRGRPNAAVVINPAGSRELVTSYTVLRVVGGSTAPAGPVPIDPAVVRQIFSSSLDALPAEELVFNLNLTLGTVTLSPASEAQIPALLQAVRDRRSTILTVTGHTNTTGVSREANYQLGLDHANAVAVRLRAAGVDPQSLIIRSHGQDDLLVATPANTPQPENRRVEVIVRLSTTLALGILFLHPSTIGVFEHWLFDSLARTATPPANGSKVLIVEVDDAALARVGRWPWPRLQTAALVDALNAAGPSAIALGITFPEAADGDDALAKSISAGSPGRVVGGYSGSVSPALLAAVGSLQLILGSVRVCTARALLREKVSEESLIGPRRLIRTAFYFSTIGTFAMFRPLLRKRPASVTASNLRNADGEIKLSTVRVPLLGSAIRSGRLPAKPVISG